MKKLLILFIYILPLFSSPYAVQVLYVKDEKSISKDFLKNIEKLKLPYYIDVKKNSCKVIVGDFKDNMKDMRLEFVKENIACDAFIVKAKKNLVKKRKISKIKPSQDIELQTNNFHTINKQDYKANCKCSPQAKKIEKISQALKYYKESGLYTFNPNYAIEN